METQTPHPSALKIGTLVFLAAMGAITLIEQNDWKLSRIFNGDSSEQQMAAAPDSAVLLQTSHAVLTP